MNRLRDRPLERGRGRVWLVARRYFFADYRTRDGELLCAWEKTISEAHDWIREQARHAGH